MPLPGRTKGQEGTQLSRSAACVLPCLRATLTAFARSRAAPQLIDFAEFAVLLSKLLRVNSSEKKLNEVLQRFELLKTVFDALDEDGGVQEDGGSSGSSGGRGGSGGGDGALNTRELGAALELFGLGADEADVQRLKELMDADGSGRIEFAEYVWQGSNRRHRTVNASHRCHFHCL